MSDDTRQRLDESGPESGHELETADYAEEVWETAHGASGAGGGPTIGVAETAGGSGIRQASLWNDAWLELRTSAMFWFSSVLIVLFVVMAVAPGLFTDVDPRDCDLTHFVERPSAEHWFGYDAQGCDYYARVIYGARASIYIGVLTTFFAALIAVSFGSMAGYYGRWTDSLIARITDIWFAIPTILGGIVLLSAWNGIAERFGWDSTRGVWQVSLVLIILGWPVMLRLMRSSVLATREADYVEAARALGASNTRIIARHILPNSIAPVMVYATIYVGLIISAEAALTFLGVGLQTPAISWGLMLAVAENRLLTDPHLLLFPGLALSLTILAFILMGDALRDALDPKLR